LKSVHSGKTDRTRFCRRSLRLSKSLSVRSTVCARSVMSSHQDAGGGRARRRWTS
jgi:hypothetical protein